MEDLAFRPALELAALIRDREVSPVEVIEEYLNRIDKLDPTINAYVTVVGDRAWRLQILRGHSSVSKGALLRTDLSCFSRLLYF